MNIIHLTPLDLFIAGLLIICLAGICWITRIGISQSLILSATRMTIQLLIVGYVIKIIFSLAELKWIVLISLIMILVASREAYVRQKRPFKGGYSFAIGTLALSVSTYLLILFTLTIIVQPTPWYAAQYSIPLLGMILGNVMTAVSLSMDRMTVSAWDNRVIIEQRLLLGQSKKEAFTQIRKDCVRIALTPMINVMAAAGIIHIPGMMTGQILAGAQPLDAAKYQILIMFLIIISNGLGIIIAASLTERRLFDQRDRLRLDRVV